MESATKSRPLRVGRADKRAAIVSSAEQLFLAHGFEGTSVDAIAAAAGVSKRTVYDYFADKQSLLHEVVQNSVRSHSAVVESAVDDHLIDVTDVERALTDFALHLATASATSYVRLMRLVAAEAARNPNAGLESWATHPSDAAVSERLAEFGRRGLLEVPDPQVAADHYGALAGPVALERRGYSIEVDAGATRQTIVDGVRVFLRAYEPRF